MSWLKESHTYLEENDMSSTLPTTIGNVFFVHPRDALISNYQAQLKCMFDEDDVPEFKVKPFLLKHGEQRAKILLIQGRGGTTTIQ
jgi:hypothetical protein